MAKLQVLITAFLLLTAGCTNSQTSENEIVVPSSPEQKSVEAMDPEGDVVFEYSKGDRLKVERSEANVDILQAKVSVSSLLLTVTFQTSSAPIYVSPTSFESDGIVDRVYSYFAYVETDGDGSFDYRLSATNNYDTGIWEGEFWALKGNYGILGGVDFPGFVLVSGNTIEIRLKEPLRFIDGAVWALCPGAEFSYSKSADEVPAGANFADYIWNGSSEDLVVGGSSAQLCMTSHPAPIIVNRSDIPGN
jgi:hypothetical protein